MGRQTSFPGILIRDIEASVGSENRTLDRGIGGTGRTIEFEEGLPENIPTERIQSFINEVRLFGDSHVDSSLTYNLYVASMSPTLAKAKSRTFVRMKNPFEPDIIDVSEPVRDSGIGPLDKGRDVYRVSVTVSK